MNTALWVWVKRLWRVSKKLRPRTTILAGGAVGLPVVCWYNVIHEVS